MLGGHVEFDVKSTNALGPDSVANPDLIVDQVLRSDLPWSEGEGRCSTSGGVAVEVVGDGGDGSSERCDMYGERGNLNTEIFVGWYSHVVFVLLVIGVSACWNG